jgi:hypothetical protein
MGVHFIMCPIFGRKTQKFKSDCFFGPRTVDNVISDAGFYIELTEIASVLRKKNAK